MTTTEMVRIVLESLAGAGLLVWFVKALFTHLLSRDLERHKSELARSSNDEVERLKSTLKLNADVAVESLKNVLTKQSTVELESLKSDLSRLAFEHQTRFASLNEKRAQVIAELYSLLARTDAAFRSFVSPLQLAGEMPINHKEAFAAREGSAFSTCFNENRIYLEEPLCEQIDAYIEQLKGTLAEMSARDIDQSAYVKAFSHFDSYAGPLRKNIETLFRGLLGIEDRSSKVKVAATQ